MDPLEEVAGRSPTTLAVIDPGGVRWTYGELSTRVDRLADALNARGVERQTNVAMRLPPSPEAVALVHAVARIGATLLPLGPSWPEPEIARALAALPEPILSVDRPDNVETWMRATDATDRSKATAVAVDPYRGIAARILTSGTTGRPRPIGISHENLLFSARRAAERLDLGSDDRWLTSLSTAHIGGLALIHRAAVVGCALVTRPRYDPAEVAQLMDDGRITHASMVPVMLERLMDARGDRPVPRTLRCLLIGGAALPLSLLEEALESGYPIALTYGLTETTSQVATAGPSSVREKPGSVGWPLSGVELSFGPPLAQGGREILVRGPSIAAGLKKGSDLDEDGWLYTGDTGYLDEDGDLWVTGRVSDRIVTGGVTVDPREVEGVLVEHPMVREVSVVGADDPAWGERVVAIVVPEDEERAPTLEDLLDFARTRLQPAKRPRESRVISALPRTANGKVDRARLRDLCS